ncbi:MAG: hypothetical protein A2Y38_07430 [Spirochaetes bacterium GWB1_59_5]|nr:MAG: hypothetical protein A2Y38_07430 [Spirochaetes bacterium GWB1_59_5]
MTRPERRERWESTFDPARLALAGVALSMTLLFQPSFAGRAAMLAGAALAAWLSGRRLSPLTTLLVMAGIVGANLLVPVGRKIATIGPLAVTELALRDGLHKAITFEALMFISKACLGSGLRLPGKFGAFFAEALRGYDRILEQKSSVKLNGFLTRIDNILVSVYDDIQAINQSADIQKTRPWTRLRRSDMVLVAVMVGAAIPLLFI